MKRVWGTALLVALVACGRTEDITSELTDAELEALRERTSAECLNSSNAQYTAFKEASGDVYASVKWQRHYGWKHQLKNGTTVDATEEIRVWKNTGTTLYLYIHKTIGTSYDKHYYLRIPSALNESMIDDLQYEVCQGRSTISGSSSGPLTATHKYIQQLSPGTKEYTDTHTFDFNHLAFAASAWKYERTTVTKDVNGTQTATSTLKGDLVEWTGQAELTTTPISGATYCDLDPSADADYPGLDNPLPYELPEPGACAASLPAGWSDFAI